ncbi:hypothetical protein GY15_24490 [Delftia sp. 670]|nr:hypothetical protein GY15_24490 [Delftia sp. 670]
MPLANFNYFFELLDLFPISGFALSNEFMLMLQYFSEISFIAVQSLKIPWIDIFIDQYRQKLVGIEQVISVGFQIGSINSVLIKYIVNQPQVV